jgi:hypothetical protein
MSGRPGPRSCDSVVLGNLEADAWAAYYLHQWRTFLVAAVAMVRRGFGMNLVRSVAGAYHVLRAIQLWAPYPDNDPDGARESMRHFYALVVTAHGLGIDPVRASQLEVEWWRLHREHQYGVLGDEQPLLDALMHLYSYVYGVPEETVREAARERVQAMEHSDAWVQAGCDLADPRLGQERKALVASYRALRAAVGH